MSRSTSLRLTQILVGRTQEDVREAAFVAARRLGFAHLIFGGSFSPREPSGEVRFDNVADEWHRHCVGRSRDLLPGALRRQALQQVTPLLWSQAVPEAAGWLARARKCGLAAGVSCSVRGPSGQWSLTSFATPRSGAPAERHIVRVLPDCQFIACAIHYAAARIAGRVPVLPLRRRLGNGLLSERESQCLLESARGKTTAEIAQILQISERTVAFHLANLRRKLDAANSRHAVTKAFSLRLIAAA
jgi:LuxR family transcriptional activator of conjugal transfer of Ti plasmids